MCVGLISSILGQEMISEGRIPQSPKFVSRVRIAHFPHHPRYKNAVLELGYAFRRRRFY